MAKSSSVVAQSNPTSSEFKIFVVDVWSLENSRVDFYLAVTWLGVWIWFPLSALDNSVNVGLQL